MMKKVQKLLILVLCLALLGAFGLFAVACGGEEGDCPPDRTRGDNPPPVGRIDSPKNLEGLLLSGCLGKLSE